MRNYRVLPIHCQGAVKTNQDVRVEPPYPYAVALVRRDTDILWSVSEIKFCLYQK